MKVEVATPATFFFPGVEGEMDACGLISISVQFCPCSSNAPGAVLNTLGNVEVSCSVKAGRKLIFKIFLFRLTSTIQRHTNFVPE